VIPVESSTASRSVSSPRLHPSWIVITFAVSVACQISLYSSYGAALCLGALSSPMGPRSRIESRDTVVQGQLEPPPATAMCLPTTFWPSELLVCPGDILFVPGSLIRLLEHFQICVQDGNLAQLSGSFE